MRQVGAVARGRGYRVLGERSRARLGRPLREGSLGEACGPGGDSRSQAPSGGFGELVQESGAPGMQGGLGDVPRGSSEGTGFCWAPKATLRTFIFNLEYDGRSTGAVKQIGFVQLSLLQVRNTLLTSGLLLALLPSVGSEQKCGKTCLPPATRSLWLLTGRDGLEWGRKQVDPGGNRKYQMAVSGGGAGE